MKKFIFSLACLFLLEACNFKENRESSDSAGVAVDSIYSEVLIPDPMLVLPTSMTVTDRAIVVADSYKADTLISVYSLDGSPVARLLPKGSGPGEGLWVPNIQYDKVDNSLYAPDLDKQSIFHILEYAADSPRIETVMSHKSESETDTIILQGQIVHMANGLLIAANQTNRGMVAEFDSYGKPLSVRIPFPDKRNIDERLTDWANINLYYPTLKVSPDGRFAAITFSISDMKIFVTVEGNELRYRVIDGAFPNDIFINQSGPDFVQGFATKDTKIYTQDLTLSDRYAYQLYLGMSKEEISQTDYFKDTQKNGSQIVKVYDKDGNVVRELILDRWVKAIAVSPDDRFIYGLTESSEDGNSVLRFKM
ncbi:MAG: TolB-like 6-bladed beta-propeller domain-containing protein [Muribaculaceae bacterium]|nr:TolB-like 6-bladed beta-propeller domain-containing protein [Muribaculaceae bacterium]